MTVDLKALADRVHRGEADEIRSPENHRRTGICAYYRDGPFTVSCFDDINSTRAMAARLRKGPPELGTPRPVSRVSLKRAPFEWGVVKRFIRDDEIRNALNYLELYDLDPVVIRYGKDSALCVVCDLTEFEPVAGFKAFVGRVWVGQRWETTTVEPHTGKAVHGSNPKKPLKPTGSFSAYIEQSKARLADAPECVISSALFDVRKACEERHAAGRWAELLMAYPE